MSNSYASVAIHAIVGGTISKATGGKFANGAYSAAFASALREAQASASRTGVGSSSEAETDATKQNREAFEARIKELVNDGTIDPKKTFLTMDLAAKEILGVLSPLYEQYGLEAGGYIVKNGKLFSYTSPIVGGARHLDLNPHYGVAGYHTHPPGSWAFSNEINNPGSRYNDVNWVRTANKPLYMGFQRSGATIFSVCEVNAANCSNIGNTLDTIGGRRF